MAYTKYISEYFEKIRETLNRLDIQEIDKAMSAIASANSESTNIYIFGNGGSSATASHFVCDFNKGVSDNREHGFNFICLNDNTPILTAIANDIGYEDIFVHQLEKVLKKDDLVIAISGSGSSKNVIKAVEYAKEIGCKVIGLTGYDGGKLKELTDYSMHVPIDDMQITEDIHMMFDHMMVKTFCNFDDKQR